MECSFQTCLITLLGKVPRSIASFLVMSKWKEHAYSCRRECTVECRVECRVETVYTITTRVPNCSATVSRVPLSLTKSLRRLGHFRRAWHARPAVHDPRVRLTPHVQYHIFFVFLTKYLVSFFNSC
jgi:hypothetical protein